MVSTRDERRSAHLLFGEELALGEVSWDAVLASPEVGTAVRTTPVPSAVSRALQRAAVASGRLSYVGESVGPMVAAREAVLGERAAAPARFLLRLDAFPETFDPDAAHRRTDGLREVDAILRSAGVPYLLTVHPRVARDPLDPAAEESRGPDWAERALLDELILDHTRPGGAVAFGVGGLDGRTRHAAAGKRSELAGRKRKDLIARLDQADAAMGAIGLPADVLVPPYDRVDARQYGLLAARYDVVTGGPAALTTLGWHRTPQWRGDAVWLPAYAPWDGPAAAVLPAVEELAARRPGLWVPITLRWGEELDAGLDALRRLAASLAGQARPWDEFLAGVRASRGAG